MMLIRSIYSHAGKVSLHRGAVAIIYFETFILITGSGDAMQDRHTYESKVENKLYLFKTQIEALQAFEADSEAAQRWKINSQIRFLWQKQKALEKKFQSFQATGGSVKREMKRGIDALLKDMIRSISKVHLQCIEAVY